MPQLLAYFIFLTKQAGFPDHDSIRVFPVSILEKLNNFHETRYEHFAI
jgi:hypothetical protein